MNLKERAKKLKSDIPAVAFALKAKETPLAAKIIAAVTVAYVLSPIDFIPDFIPVIGYLDELILLPILVKLTVKLIPPEIFNRYREQAKKIQANGNAKKWYYAIPVVLIWLLIIWLVVKAIWL